MRMLHSMTLVGKAVIWLLLVLATACSSDQKSFLELNGQAQGTTFNISYEGTSDYAVAVDSIFKAMDASMSLWLDSSAISRFNAAAEGLEIDENFKNVYLKSLEINKLSEGSFDPSLGPLIKLWGFSRKNNLPFPDTEAIESLKQFIGFEMFTLEANYLKKKNPNIQLDFNAIAQGYTVDVIAEYLERKEIDNYLIEIGGEIRAKGHNSRNEPWKVGIEKPEFNQDDKANPLQEVVMLQNASLATSGSYRKFFEKDGKKYSHTIDPQTGRPVEHNLLSVSVIASSSMEADAWATVFMVWGEERSIKYANEHHMKIFCLSDQRGQIQETYSEGFKELVINP